MGSRGRFREKRVASKSILLGYQITEFYNPVTKTWNETHRLPMTYTPQPATRGFRTIAECSDFVNWPGPPYHFGKSLDIFKAHDGGLSLRPCTSGGWVYASSVCRERYEGYMIPNFYLRSPRTLNSTFRFADVGFDDLTTYGPGAYQRYSPTKPSVDLGQFLAEIREIPKMLYTSALHFVQLWRSIRNRPQTLRLLRGNFYQRQIASEWLNTQFGWVPFLGTVVDFIKAMNNLNKRITWLQRNNRKWIRRGGPVDTTESERILAKFLKPSLIRPSVSSVFKDRGTVTVTERVTKSVWFSAYMKYYIPNIKIWYGETKLLKLIMGLEITPALLWELVPFSWLIDWGANVGDVLANWRDNFEYNLVSRNAFIMGKTQNDVVITTDRTLGSHVNHGEWIYRFSRQQREEASPFGFGVRFQDLSAWRVSILAALGITKGW